jgi:ubiquinone/menaquinone biosynthesis C-methylase UbiE
MPTMQWNKETWDGQYNWDEGGEEWSEIWGGSDMEWYGAILTRIHAFIPAKRILELAPGFGRWTHFLRAQCDQLHVVDYSEQCIERCKKRFRNDAHVTYWVNDGRSLEMIDDESIDFIFSFDSLVHCEEDVIERYVSQLRSKLTPNGVSFLHHSNFGSCLPPIRDWHLSSRTRWRLAQLRLLDSAKRLGIVDQGHFRSRSMTAEKMRTFASRYGLRCIAQETVNWGTTKPIDCFSTLVRSDAAWPVRELVRENRSFMSEARDLRRLSALYGRRALQREQPM